MKNRCLPALSFIFFVFFTQNVHAQNDVVQINGPIFLCEGACDTLFATINANVLQGPYTYLWTVSGPGGFSSNTASSTLHFCADANVPPMASGTYFFKLIVTGVNGQSAMDNFTVTVLPYQPLNIISSNLAPCNFDSLSTSDQCEQVCPNTTVTYSVDVTNPSGSQSYIQWTVTGATSFTVNNQPFNTSITVQWGTPGVGSVSVTSNGSGTIGSCSGEDALCVTIIPEPVAQFVSDPLAAANAPLQICKGQTVYFTNQSLGGDFVEWQFSDDASTTAEVNPQHTFFNPGNYTVTLIARSNCLCADTTTLMIEVLDAESPALDCIGTVCPGATITYAVSSGCAPFTWSVSGNGTILGGGTSTTDSITVQWNAGPVGTITLGALPCSGTACPQPAVLQVPVISDAAEIKGPDRVCPSSIETYSIEPYGGTNFVWTLSSGGTISSGQGTHSITVNWSDFPNPAQTNWLSVQYDNCYLGCGGQDSMAVLLLSPFIINGPIERCEGSSGAFNAFLINGSTAVSCNWTLVAPDGSTAWTSPTATASASVVFASGGGIYRLLAYPANPNVTCSDQASWTISVSPSPTKLTGIDGPKNICPGTTYTYNAQGVTGNNNVHWTIKNGPGATTVFDGNQINVTWGNSGPRWLSAAQVSANGLGCSSDTLQLIINAVGMVSIAGDPIVCENSTGTYSLLNIDKIDIQWQVSPPTAAAVANGQGTNTAEIFWTEAGGHVVSVSVCGQTATFPVTVPTNPVPVVQYTVGLCPGSMSAVQTTTAFSSYRWLDEAGALLSTAVSPSLPAGTYAVEVTDPAGCTGISEFTVDAYANPNLSISTADPTGFCNNASFVTLTALTTSDLDFTYQWFQNGTPVGGNTATYTTNQYGNYTCQVTNQFGCTATAGPVLLFNYCGGGGGGYGFPGGGPPPCPGSVDMAILPTATCESFQFNLIPGPLYTPGTANWVFAQSGATIIGSAMNDNPSFTFPNAGKYIVLLTVQLSNGTACYVLDSLNVNAVADFDAAPVCPGYSSAFKDLTTFLPQFSISSWAWNFGDVPSGPNNTSFLTDAPHTFISGGTFNVQLTVTTSSGCSSTSMQIITVPAPAPLSLVAPPLSCAGNALQFVATGNPDVTDIAWDFGDPASGAANDASGSPAYHSFSTPGPYMVTATSTNVFGCTATFIQNVNIANNTLAGIITPANPGAICEGKTITLNAPAGATSYFWSDSTTTTQAITVNQAGNYRVTLTDANGCTFVPPPVKVDVLPAPDALIKALLSNDLGQVVGTSYPTLSSCFGEDVHLVAVGNGAYGYAWSGSNGYLSDVVFDQGHNNLLSVGTHVYTVTVTDILSGCTAATDPFVVTVNPVPSGFSIAANGTCANASTTITYTGPNPGNWQYFWNNGQSGTPLVTDNSGVYYLRVINEFGCEAKSNAVTILPGPPVSAIPGGCHTRCKPDTLCMPDLPGIISWQWFFNGSPVAGATGPDFVAQQSGTYWAQVTDIYGCPGQSDPLELNLYDGYGDITGQVWSDVNGNGIIDAMDTLVSGIPVLLLENGTIANAAQSGAIGDFSFVNILSTDYTVLIDPTTLGSNWQIVIGQDDVTLSGCDALGSTDLLVEYHCVVNSTLQLFACPGDAVPFNGTFIAAGASQMFQYVTAAGCDSLQTVSVGTLSPSSATLAVSVCPGAVYNYNGTSIPAGQSATVTIQNYLGCDSIVTVTVSTLPVSTKTLAVSVCPGETYDYFGSPISIGQSANFTFQNYLGCDSLVTITVSAIPIATGSFEAGVCPGQTYDYNGTPLNGGDVATFTLQSVAGCDSIVTVTIKALQASANTINTAVCPGETFLYNGVTLHGGDVQDFILINAAGCDSIVTVRVQQLVASANTEEFVVCPGQTYDYNGTAIAVGDTTVLHFIGFEGCDSSVTVIVTAFPDAAFTVQADNSCPNSATGSLMVLSSSGGLPPYRYSIDGNSYQDEPVFDDLEPGDYTIYMEDSNACVFERVSTIQALPVLDVVLTDGILPCDTSAVALEPVVNLDPLGLNFKWWNGATTPTIMVSDPGPIWVEVTNECGTVHKDANVNWADLDGSVNFVYVPNVFAPDADNYENTIFKPYFPAGMEILNYKFEVFDRWGNLMFRTNQPDAGWEGAFRKIDFQPGVVVWYILADVSYCGRVITLKREGDVTIVR